MEDRKVEDWLVGEVKETGPGQKMRASHPVGDRHKRDWA